MGRQNQKEDEQIFRLSFVDDKTHKSVWALRFRRHGLALTIVSVFLSVVALAFGVIALTPLRTLIPGYPDANSRKAAIANAIKIDSLESAMTRWTIYSENLKRVLSGEETGSLDSLLKAGSSAYLSDKSREELSKRDSVLRETVRDEEQFQISGTQRSLPLDGRHFFPPLKGVISQGYDRVLHPALDISAPAGSVVSAVYDGTVIFAGWDDNLGNIIILQHEGDLVTIYQHNQKLLKKTGESVKAGTSIALVGSTGSISKSEHLRFEMWHKGVSVDPTKYLGLQ